MTNWIHSLQDTILSIKLSPAEEAKAPASKSCLTAANLFAKLELAKAFWLLIVDAEVEYLCARDVCTSCHGLRQ